MIPNELASFAVIPVRNGYIVQGGYEFQRSGPSNGPPDWYVFETLDALQKWLRDRHEETGKAMRAYHATGVR